MSPRSGNWEAEDGKRDATRRPSALRRPPAGMTLIELIVAITIVAILGALLLGVAATAGGVAREARTNSMITRLHTLLMERYDEYRTRRVELRPDAISNLLIDSDGDNYSDATGIYLPPLLANPQSQAAAARVAALREMMRVEMPDRWSDLTENRLFLDGSPPVLTNAYIRAFNRMDPTLLPVENRHENTVTGNLNTNSDLLTNQGAECLYLVIMNATGDGEARGLFKETDTGDTDGDGALEFLDGWGNPISYLRWAPGFESDAQLSVPGLQDIYRDAERDTDDGGLSGSVAVVNTILDDHSPYDLFRVDNPLTNVPGFDESNDAPSARGWRLVPLIYSHGADEESGLADGLTQTTGGASTANYFARSNPFGVTSANLRIGASIDPEAAADNVHNHQGGSLVRTR